MPSSLIYRSKNLEYSGLLILKVVLTHIKMKNCFYCNYTASIWLHKQEYFQQENNFVAIIDKLAIIYLSIKSQWKY